MTTPPRPDAEEHDPPRNYSDPVNQILDLLCRLHYRLHGLRTQMQTVQIEIRGIKRKLHDMEKGGVDADGGNPDGSDQALAVEEVLERGLNDPEAPSLTATQRMAWSQHEN